MSEITLTRIGMMDRCVPVSSNLLLWVSSNLLLWVGCSRHGAVLSCPYDVAWVCQFQPGVDLVYGRDRGIRICMYTYVHIHTYTHTHTHTHIHAQDVTICNVVAGRPKCAATSCAQGVLFLSHILCTRCVVSERAAGCWGGCAKSGCRGSLCEAGWAAREGERDLM